MVKYGMQSLLGTSPDWWVQGLCSATPVRHLPLCVWMLELNHSLLKISHLRIENSASKKKWDGTSRYHLPRAVFWSRLFDLGGSSRGTL
jgi:hypothetical protein